MVAKGVTTMSLRFSRRSAMQALTALPAALSLGCSGSSEEEEEEGDEGALTQLEALRQYKHIVVLVMENRSFDHYFGHLSLSRAEGGEGRPRSGDNGVDGFESLAKNSNPDLNGNRVSIFKSTNYAIGDIDHEWVACHEQFAGDRTVAKAPNEGFVTAHQKDLERVKQDARVHPELGKSDVKANCYGQKEDLDEKSRCGEPNDPMAFYTRQDTPVYHKLLDEYVLCDKWFASVMGPTWPNRFYVHAGTSDGVKANSPLWGMGAAARNSIFGQIEARKKEIAKELPGVDPNRLCVNFFADVPLLPLMFMTAVGNSIVGPNFNYARVFKNQRNDGLETLQRFGSSVFGAATPEKLFNAVAAARINPTFEDLCEKGQLPAVSYIEPPFQLAPMDDHPPHDIKAGQAFVASVYQILLKTGRLEKDTLLIITYDEHGSFYDHVAPPKVKEDTNAEFQQLGFRVPALVIGKGVKKGVVNHTQFDHCSILSTATKRYGLAPSNDRVRVANDISSCLETSTSGGAAGDAKIQSVELSEAHVLETARIAAGQAEIVQKVFNGHVPFEAKRIFTNSMFEIFDRLGVATIKR